MHSGESAIDYHGEVIHRHRDAIVTQSIKFLLMLHVTWRKILLLLEPPVWKHLPHAKTLCLLKGRWTLPVYHKSSGLCRIGTENTLWWCVHDFIRSVIRLGFEVCERGAFELTMPTPAGGFGTLLPFITFCSFSFFIMVSLISP